MVNLSLFWARLALSLYTFGLATAWITLAVRRQTLFRLARGAVALGFCFHFVSLVEMGVAVGRFPVTQYSEASSLLAFIIVAVFLAAYRFYSPPSLAVVVFPLVFALTLTSIYGNAGVARVGLGAPAVVARNAWIYWHAALIFLGYAALVLAFAAGLLYLLAERRLRRRPPLPGPSRWLPPLEVLDRWSYRALLFGFPLLTAGLAIGLYWANAAWGTLDLRDPKIALTLLAWATFVLLLFSRWSRGWRGRRAAYATVICFVLAAAGWLTGNASGLHHFFPR